MNLEEVRKLLAETIVQIPKEERGEKVRYLLDSLRADLSQPQNIKFSLTAEQRLPHIKKLSGKEFSATHRGFSAIFSVTIDGKFQNPKGEVFDRPTPALQSQWNKVMSNKEVSYNGWTAKDKNGKNPDDYIREFIIKS